MRLTAAWAAIAFACAAPVAAQSPAAPADDTTIADGEDIVVTGMGSGGYRLTADQLRDAVRAFQGGRESFAPDAALLWRVIPAGAAEGLELRLVSGDQRLPISIDSQARFALPAAAILTGRWRLQSNAGRRQIRIAPLVLSPGSTLADMRFGDARLLCRVFWAFANNNYGPLTRMAFGAVGGCGSRRVSIWYRSELPIAAATVGDRVLPLRPDGFGYNPPLHDRAIGNEARLRLTYR